MIIAMVSCLKYADCWQPFTTLFRKFWPNCGFDLVPVTDEANPGQSWCSVVAEFANEVQRKTHGELVMLLQEDFLLNAPVNESLILKAMMEMVNQRAVMVRLYPCPGADIDYGDPHFGIIDKEKPYSVSCQATIWRPKFLAELASHFDTPQEFEIEGSKMANEFDFPFLALKRDCPQPWPLSYYCTAIVNSRWQQGALDLCAMHGIEVDTSMREIAA